MRRNLTDPYDDTMTIADSRVTLHMAASLDGYIARKDGRVDWLETSDEYAEGETLSAESVSAFLGTIDCYVMGSRTYETAMTFESKGFGWAYGSTPTFVFTRRDLPRIRETIELRSGDLEEQLHDLRSRFPSIWIVGGGALAGECMQRGLVDEIRYSILPIVIGEGISFFGNLKKDVALHLAEVTAYRSGIVDLRYEIRRQSNGD